MQKLTAYEKENKSQKYFPNIHCEPHIVDQFEQHFFRSVLPLNY